MNATFYILHLKICGGIDKVEKLPSILVTFLKSSEYRIKLLSFGDMVFDISTF